MKYIGLDEREYSLNIGRLQEKSKRSSYHQKAYELASALYPCDQIYEEIPIKGCGNTLYGDIFIPSRSILIEVHGEQHYTHSPFFHKDKLAFYRAKARDNKKREWCKLNNITLIELDYNESEQQWREKFT